MKLVVDSNVLFTFFWKNSIFNALSIKQELELFSPVFALKEIDKYSSEISKKTKLSQSVFKDLRKALMERVGFIPLEAYSSILKQAPNIIKNLSKEEYEELINDIDFLALALKLNCPIWSNDKLFKKQSKITVFSTEEIILLFE